MEQRIHILIVDDHPVVLEGMKALLQDNDMVEVDACCSNGQDALAFLLENKVDVILLDINLPDISGIDLCKLIKQQYADIHIVAISNYNERSMITKMLQNGATGYVLKNASAEEIIDAIRAVVKKTVYFSPEVQKSLFEAALDDPLDLPKLTRREQEVLRCIAEGKTTAEIGDTLFISPHTVETHRRNLMQKFQVSNAAALIRVASQYQLI
ncbi:response regulator transcription factor [Olivibacter domesticus]|uniref:Two component transcriptional regulator, LuxR family n=1 Tax=Olivibacter domesticus TaxID=407022 RepID=A0A1H7TGG9_OLID1|nr:response regulator transcription factor [Olivibacter domesticus]SEL83665.1 two component transcriptional regulator, LuxR family [Olivibacter domesticus]